MWFEAGKTSWKTCAFCGLWVFVRSMVNTSTRHPSSSPHACILVLTAILMWSRRNSMASTTGLLGSKGGWIQRMVLGFQQKQKTAAPAAGGSLFTSQQQASQKDEAVAGSHNNPAGPAAQIVMPASSTRLVIDTDCAPAPLRACLKRLPSDAGMIDCDNADIHHKSPKPDEIPTGFRGWYLLLREQGPPPANPQRRWA